MKFELFAKENCPVCTKAQQVLSGLKVDLEIRYVDGPKATPENLADFAWFDWSDKAPLVVAVEDGRPLMRWDGSEIAKPGEAWTPKVQGWLDAQRGETAAHSSGV